MRIGINATFRMHGGGVGHLRNLLASWSRTGIDRRHHIVLFTRPENIPYIQAYLSESIEVHSIGRHSITSIEKVLWEQITFPWLLRSSKLDVLLCPGNVVPLLSPVPTVVAFRNAAPFCSGVNIKLVGLLGWLNLKVLGTIMRLSARSARRVIFVSQYFKNLFVDRYGFQENRGDILYHGRDDVQFNQLYPSRDEDLVIQAPYILCVSHLQRYKNLSALIKAYSLAKEALQSKELRLVIVGKPESEDYFSSLKRMVECHHLTSWVIFTGNVPHEAIPRLMAECRFFLFQSMCENCPNSLIEALSAGLPIACSNASVMPEIAGDAALYFDPSIPEEIANALITLAENSSLCSELRAKALTQSQKFPTWDQVGLNTLETLDLAVHNL
ncbi:glycosyltransferase family 1 protein [Candidatus Nitronereus thalassa]|uniref:Glycosyltransferase family 1 protein n=1 Tax=Candidatus Nitronereus thalassa TaxID=3020898 RepID=A0ABU3K5G4_9BACT|nr:glycosyltransferase family 1 protein [Candidatus Nitronereus thalassa]MDT7041657.1 glycosyltransferase family 1 protein [Candidatus Nitronereus thalassa]